MRTVEVYYRIFCYAMNTSMACLLAHEFFSNSLLYYNHGGGEKLLVGVKYYNVCENTRVICAPLWTASPLLLHSPEDCGPLPMSALFGS